MPASKQRKIAVIGGRSVGKSSLIIQFIEGHFVDSYDPTIENTFNRIIRVNQQEYDVKLMDTAGLDEFSLFPPQYCIDVHGYVLVYSITSSQSFEVVSSIYEKLLDIAGKSNVPVVLVGNKTDLHLERQVSSNQGKELAERNNAIFLETSAKENVYVSDVFHSLLREIEKANGNNSSDKSNCSVS